jgi:hypothetical protein
MRYNAGCVNTSCLVRPTTLAIHHSKTSLIVALNSSRNNIDSEHKIIALVGELGGWQAFLETLERVADEQVEAEMMKLLNGETETCLSHFTALRLGASMAGELFRNNGQRE